MPVLQQHWYSPVPGSVIYIQEEKAPAPKVAAVQPAKARHKPLSTDPDRL